MFPAFTQSIHFLNNTDWNKTIEKAKTENKLIFIDVYTDWCGPCKQMDAEVFTDKNVGNQMNSQFINYKLNAEKGEGVLIAKKYNVFSYPTYLFVDGNGTLIYRAEGFMPVEKFMKETANALIEQKDSVTLLQMDKVYDQKKKDTTFMYAYLRKRTQLLQDNAELLDEYCALLQKDQQASLKTLQLLADNGGFNVRSLQLGKAFYILYENQDKFHLLENIEDIDNYITMAQQKTLTNAIATKDEKLLSEILKINRSLNPEIYEDEYDDKWKIEFYQKTDQKKKFLAIAQQYLDRKLMRIADSTLERKDKMVLNAVRKNLESHLANKTKEEADAMLASYQFTQSIQYIRTVNEVCTKILNSNPNQKMLRKGVKWMHRSLSIAEKDTDYFKNIYPFCLKIYASYLYQTGNNIEAIHYQTKAVELISAPKFANLEAEIETFKLLLDNMKQNKTI